MRSVMPWDNSKFWRMASKKGLLLEVDCEEGLARWGGWGRCLAERGVLWIDVDDREKAAMGRWRVRRTFA